MIKYKVSYTSPHRQYIDFEASFPCKGKSQVSLQLPAWRPGRYELGNFAKLIRSWAAFDERGDSLAFAKTTKDLWQIETNGCDFVTIKYDFYANTLNAGSTWLDEEQLYVNPVNCFFYLPDQQDLGYEIELDIPEDYQVACGMNSPKKHVLKAANVQEVMDCPFIASNSIQKWTYEVDKVDYHIWVQGEIHFDIERFINEHKAFTISQLKAFESIPCDEYHFMYQFPAFQSRHGVEHQNSTVITMGPAIILSEERVYRELIGISCHELYHTWNIKSIRPVEMMPYDFSKENYSRLGYVAEGVTTYFGDQYLHRCGAFDDEEFFGRLATTIERHIHNPARFNHSVAESSWDTWLDGYVSGIPGRKVSIYNEGSLTALITDLWILSSTGGTRSLDDVMRILYQEKGLYHTGYSEKDYRAICNSVAAKPVDEIFDLLIYGVEDYVPWLDRMLATIGMEIDLDNNPDSLAREAGLKLDKSGSVIAVYPNSPGDTKGIALGDSIVAVNGIKLEEFNRTGEETISVIQYSRHGKIRDVAVEFERNYYPKLTVALDLNRTKNQSSLYAAWCRKGNIGVENFESL